MFVSEIVIVTSISLVWNYIQIFIFEARWSNSLSTSSSVYAIVAFPYSDCFRESVIAYSILHPSDDSFPYTLNFCVSFYLHILYFVYVRSLSVCYYLFLCAICISQCFSLFLSFFFSVSLCSFHCSSSMRQVINPIYSYSATCEHLYIIITFHPSFFCLSLFSSSLSHYHFFQQILSANNLLLFFFCREHRWHQSLFDSKYSN